MAWAEIVQLEPFMRVFFCRIGKVLSSQTGQIESEGTPGEVEGEVWFNAERFL
jgi:hypothetical protein